MVPLDLRVILFRVVEDPFSDHGADGIQVGVESNGLPLHSLGVGVVHGVLEGGLAVVVFVDGAAGVLCFWCGSAFEKTKQNKKTDVLNILQLGSGEKSQFNRFLHSWRPGEKLICPSETASSGKIFFVFKEQQKLFFPRLTK